MSFLTYFGGSLNGSSEQEAILDDDAYVESVKSANWGNQFALVLDAEGDGLVSLNDLMQLSGSERSIYNLNWLDANGDGKIDKNDPGFVALRVWGDADGREGSMLLAA